MTKIIERLDALSRVLAVMPSLPRSSCSVSIINLSDSQIADEFAILNAMKVSSSLKASAFLLSRTA